MLEKKGLPLSPGGLFAPLRYRDFRLFWIGHFISRVGDSMQQTAISWLLYDMTASALQLGINGAFLIASIAGGFCSVPRLF